MKQINDYAPHACAQSQHKAFRHHCNELRGLRDTPIQRVQLPYWPHSPQPSSHRALPDVATNERFPPTSYLTERGELLALDMQINRVRLYG